MNTRHLHLKGLTKVEKNVWGMASYILTKAAPSCLNVSGAFGRRRNRRPISPQTSSIGDRSGKTADDRRKWTVFRCRNVVTTLSCCRKVENGDVGGHRWNESHAAVQWCHDTLHCYLYVMSSDADPHHDNDTGINKSPLRAPIHFLTPVRTANMKSGLVSEQNFTILRISWAEITELFLDWLTEGRECFLPWKNCCLEAVVKRRQSNCIVRWRVVLAAVHAACPICDDSLGSVGMDTL